MESGDIPLIALTNLQTHLSSSYNLPPRCVFCGMGDSANFGQGELLRWRTLLSPLPLPKWLQELKPSTQGSKQNIISIPIQHVHEVGTKCSPLPLTPTHHLVGNYCSLDSCRRLSEGRITDSVGKPVLSGIPTAFIDTEGRPFGYIDELVEMGWPVVPEGREQLMLQNLLVTCSPREGGEGSWFYAHHCCASWSKGVKMNEHGLLEGVEEAAVKALRTVCSLCRRLGASLTCQADGCQCSFHYPCAAGSGCFQEIKSLTIYCPSHLNLVSALGESATPCYLCEKLSEIVEMVFCTSCGSHFHNSCLELQLTLSPTLRIGWQCPDCKTCLICCENKDDTKMVICDVCDKAVHTYCLKPPFASIPKNGFKCERCRTCSDCGLRRFNFLKGFGASSDTESVEQSTPRWHSNYTLCDRCFQTRKRQGNCCAVCERAFRCCINFNGSVSAGSSVWPGRKCNGCKRMVHFDCDPIGQSAILSSSSPTGVPAPIAAGSEEGACSQAASCTNYFCPTCRTRDCTTPSEVLSTTASLRTSPFVGGTGSSDLGEGSSVVASTSPSLADDTQQQAPTLSGSSIQHRALSVDSSIFVAADAGKQMSSCGDSLVITATAPATTVSSNPVPKSPKGVASGTTRCYKGVGRPSGSLTKSKSVSSNIGHEPSRKRIKMDHGESSKPSKSTSIVSTISIHFPTTTKPQTAKTVGTKRSMGSAVASNMACSVTGIRPRRSKNRKSGTRVYKISSPVEESTRASSSPPQVLVPGFIHSTPLTLTVRFKKRGRPSKLDKERIRSLSNSSLDSSESKSNEDDHPSTVVIGRVQDRFSTEQDICVACGSIGLEAGLLVPCAHCGQCYHYYCGGLRRIVRSVIEKGWRCLECTICEGCGQNTDEERLMLCDDCDISYHTYCLKPPLKEVPKGTWKCDNCVRCHECDKQTPGRNCEWCENYTLCGPCASNYTCPTCTLPYRESDLLIKCNGCERWSHAGCDQIRSHQEVDYITDDVYYCSLCRERGDPYGPNHRQVLKFRESNGNVAFSASMVVESDLLFVDKCSGLGTSLNVRSDDEQDNIEPRLYYMDGTLVTLSGLNAVRKMSLQGQAKKVTGTSRQKNAQAASSATPDTQSVVDTAPPSVYTPADEEVSQHSGVESTIYGEMAKSPRSVLSEEDTLHGGGATGDSSSTATGGVTTNSTTVTGFFPTDATSSVSSTTPIANAAAASTNVSMAVKKTKGNSAQSRRLLNIGIGGFRARPNRIYQTKKSLASEGGIVPSGPSKKRRPNKKKSDLEETYPEALMQAFFGEKLMVAASNATKTTSRKRTSSQVGGQNRTGGLALGPIDPLHSTDPLNIKRTADGWSRFNPSMKPTSPRGDILTSPVPGSSNRSNYWPGDSLLQTGAEDLMEDDLLDDEVGGVDDGTGDGFDDPEARDDVDDVFNIPSTSSGLIGGSARSQPPQPSISVQRTPRNLDSSTNLDDVTVDDFLYLASNFDSSVDVNRTSTAPANTTVASINESVTLQQRVEVPQDSLSVNVFNDHHSHGASEMPPKDVEFGQSQLQNQPLFLDDNAVLASPGSQEMQQGPNQSTALTPSTPNQQSQPDVTVLPELSATDVESQLHECENLGGSGGGALSTDVRSPPPPSQAPQTPLSRLDQQPMSVQPSSVQSPFPMQAENPAYVMRTPPQYHAPSQGRVMPAQQPQQQQRPPFYVQQHQEGYASDPHSQAQTQPAPPPPPYPMSRAPINWRPQMPQQQPQRFPHFQQQQLGLVPPSQQQHAQHRFQGMCQSMTQNPMVNASAGGNAGSPKARQLYPVGQYESVPQQQQPPPTPQPVAQEGGMLSSQHLKTMLRQDYIPRRPGMELQQQQQMGNEGMPSGAMLAAPPTPISMDAGDEVLGGSSLPDSVSAGASAAGVGAGPVNRRCNHLKWADEVNLGENATIAPVLYVNTMHPELKNQFTDPMVRAREIQKIWRRLSPDQRIIYVNRARANKTQSRAASSNSLSPRSGAGGNMLQPSSSVPRGHPVMASAGMSYTTIPQDQPRSAGQPVLSNYTQSPPTRMPPQHQHHQQQQQVFSQQPQTPRQMLQMQGHMHLSPSSGPQVSAQSLLQKPASYPDLAQSSLPMTSQSSELVSSSSIGLLNAAIDAPDVVGGPVLHQQPMSVRPSEDVLAAEAPVFPVQQQAPPGLQVGRCGPPSLPASQPSPPLSPSSSLMGGGPASVGGLRKGGPTSLPPPPSHTAEPASPAVASPSQQHQHKNAGLHQNQARCTPGATPDQSNTAMTPSQQQQQTQGTYLPPPPPPTWGSAAAQQATYGPGSMNPTRWSPSPMSPAPPAQQQQHLYQQQRQQQEMMQQQQHYQQQHYVSSPRPVPPSNHAPFGPNSFLNQQPSTSMPAQHYVGTGASHQSQPIQSPLTPQQHQQSTILPPGERERQKLREILAKKVSQKQLTDCAAKQQHDHQQQVVASNSPGQNFHQLQQPQSSSIPQSPQQQPHHQQMYTHTGSPYTGYSRQQQGRIPHSVSQPPLSAPGSCGGVFFPGSPPPQQISQQTQQSGSSGNFARGSPSFESGFALQQSQHTPRISSGGAAAAQSPAVSTSPHVAVSPAGGVSVPPSLCSPPVLPASTSTAGHHFQQEAPPPPPPYQVSTPISATVIESPRISQTPSQPPTPAKAPSASMEEAGFEPPVIFSRVVGAGAGKERPRFIPQQPLHSMNYAQGMQQQQQRHEQIVNPSQYEQDYRYHQSPPRAEIPRSSQQFYTTQMQHRQSPAVPVSSTPHPCESSVNEAPEGPAQYLISDSQPSQYGVGYMPPSYSRVRQPTGYAASPSSATSSRLECPHSVPPHPSNLYEQQQQRQVHMSPQPQFNPYSVPPQSPYTAHLPQKPQPPTGGQPDDPGRSEQ